MVERYTHKLISQWSEVFGEEHDKESFLHELNKMITAAERLQGTYLCERDGKDYKVLSIFVSFSKHVVFWVDEHKKCAVAMRRFKTVRGYSRSAGAPAGREL